jgi:hypothetical protein
MTYSERAFLTKSFLLLLKLARKLVHLPAAGVLGGVVQRLKAPGRQLIDVVAVQLQRARVARRFVPKAGQLAFELQRRLHIAPHPGAQVELLEGGGLELHGVEVAHLVAHDTAAAKALDGRVVLGACHVLRLGCAPQPRTTHQHQRHARAPIA